MSMFKCKRKSFIILKAWLCLQSLCKILSFIQPAVSYTSVETAPTCQFHSSSIGKKAQQKLTFKNFP